MRRLPARVVVALCVTTLAIGVLAVVSTRSRGDGSESTPTTAAPVGETTVSVVAEQSTTTTSIAVLPDWYPKRTSRYSDRRPPVTVTTLAPTTTTTDRDSEGSSGSNGSGD